jgi:hypothetical protein
MLSTNGDVTLCAIVQTSVGGFYSGHGRDSAPASDRFIFGCLFYFTFLKFQRADSIKYVYFAKVLTKIN